MEPPANTPIQPPSSVETPPVIQDTTAISNLEKTQALKTKFFSFHPVRDLIALGILLVFSSNALSLPFYVKPLGVTLFWVGCLYFIYRKYFVKKPISL